jgi:hypothetical protein
MSNLRFLTTEGQQNSYSKDPVPDEERLLINLRAEAGKYSMHPRRRGRSKIDGRVKAGSEELEHLSKFV